MPTHAEMIERLIGERDEARAAAREFWGFIEMGDFRADCGYESGRGPGTPEFELWAKAVFIESVAHDCQSWLMAEESDCP
jgi:hypothetical protein